MILTKEKEQELKDGFYKLMEEHKNKSREAGKKKFIKK